MPALNVMLQGYHQLLLQRNMLHSNAAIQPLRTDMSFEEQERRLRLNYEVFMHMLKDEVELTARMVTHFRPFLRLPPNERVCELIIVFNFTRSFLVGGMTDYSKSYIVDTIQLI